MLNQSIFATEWLCIWFISWCVLNTHITVWTFQFRMWHVTHAAQSPWLLSISLLVSWAACCAGDITLLKVSVTIVSACSICLSVNDFKSFCFNDFNCSGLHTSGTYQKAYSSHCGWPNTWIRFLPLWFCSSTWTGMTRCGRSARWNALPELKLCGKYCHMPFHLNIFSLCS